MFLLHYLSQIYVLLSNQFMGFLILFWIFQIMELTNPTTMAAMSQLRFSPLSGTYHARMLNPKTFNTFPCSLQSQNRSFPLMNPKVYEPNLPENFKTSPAVMEKRWWRRQRLGRPRSLANRPGWRVSGSGGFSGPTRANGGPMMWAV